MATYGEGYYEQTSVDGEDAGNTDLAVLYRIGKPIKGKPIIDYTLTEDIVSRDVMGQYYPSLEAGNQTVEQIRLNFYPVNANFLYWMLGKRSAAVGNARTIQNMDGTSGGIGGTTGFKPRLALWKQTNNSKRHVYGCVFGSMNLAWGNANNGMQVSMQGIGMSNGTDTFTPTITYLQSESDLWTHVDAMTWDSGDLTPYGLTLQTQQSLDSNVGYTGTIDNVNEFSSIIGEYKLICSAANGESLLVDYNAKAAKDFAWTVKKAADSTQYITFTTTNARIGTLIKQEVLNEEPIYTIGIKIQNLVCTVTDGLVA